MIKFIAAAIIAALMAAPAMAQGALKTIPSTPDISVSASATTEVVFDGGPIDWIAIKNDCSGTVYFDLRGTYTAAGISGAAYPLKLKSGESFSGTLKIYTLGVSNGTASACTFTVQPARY